MMRTVREGLNNCNNYDMCQILARGLSIKNDPLIEELRQVMKKGSSITAAVKTIGASRNQVYRWLNYQNTPTLVYRKMIEQGIIKLKSKT